MGEMLPNMVDRIIHFDKSVSPFGKKERSLREVMFTLAPFACLLRVTRRDRTMFSVAYPFEENADGEGFLDQVAERKLLISEEMAAFTHGNAEALFGPQVASEK